MEDKEEICHIFYFIFSSVLYDLFLLSAPKSLDFLSPAKAFSTEWPRYQVSEYQILYIYNPFYEFPFHLGHSKAEQSYLSYIVGFY